MKIRKNALLLAILLGLSGCGMQEDAAGADWRVSGTVVSSGTITRNGETVDVLVTVGEHSAAFYLDQPEQTLFEQVTFPKSVPDARENFSTVSFDDQNGDGESDVQLCFADESGNLTELTWLWDGAEGYVFLREHDASPVD